MKSLFVLVPVLAGLLLAAGCNEVHPQIRYKDGLDDYNHGRLTEAIGNFEEAYKGQPGDAKTCYWLGKCYLDVARNLAAEDSIVAAMSYSDKATFYFESAIMIEPSYLPAIEGKAEAQRIKGDYAKAIQTAGQTNMLTPTANTLIAKARAYAAGGDMDMALITYKQAAVAEPNNPVALEAYGRALLVAGERERAVECLRKAYTIRPTADVLATLYDLGALPDIARAGNLVDVPTPRELPEPGKTAAK
jgi:tetratricopeptide (TPR) repeat protein